MHHLEYGLTEYSNTEMNSLEEESLDVMWEGRKKHMLWCPKIQFPIAAWLLCDSNTHYPLSLVLKYFHTGIPICKGEQTSHSLRNLRASLEPPLIIITSYLKHSDLL